MAWEPLLGIAGTSVYVWLVVRQRRRTRAKVSRELAAVAARIGGTVAHEGGFWRGDRWVLRATIDGAPIEIVYDWGGRSASYAGQVAAPPGTPTFAVRPRGKFSGAGGEDVVGGKYGLHTDDPAAARRVWTPEVEAAFVALVQPGKALLGVLLGSVSGGSEHVIVHSLPVGDVTRMCEGFIELFRAVRATKRTRKRA